MFHLKKLQYFNKLVFCNALENKKTRRHKLKSASGYGSINGCEWPMPAPTRDALWHRGHGNP